MLTFNTLLRAAGLAPEGVRLLRHKDTRMVRGWSTYLLWRRNPSEFVRYEAIQGRARFPIGGHIASFVVDPIGDVVFVGLSAVLRSAMNEIEEEFPYLAEKKPHGSVTKYELVKDERFHPYEGRLVID